MPQATPHGLGDAHRTKQENHTGSEQHSSLIDRATKQLCNTAGEDNDHTTTSAPKRMTVKTRDTTASDMQQNFNPENDGDDEANNSIVHTHTHTPIMSIYTHNVGKTEKKKTIARRLL